MVGRIYTQQDNYPELRGVTEVGAKPTAVPHQIKTQWNQKCYSRFSIMVSSL